MVHIALALIILVLIGLVIFWFGNKPTNPTEEKSVTTGETVSGWQTYSSDDYSFMYPPETKTDTDAAGEGSESIRVRFIGPVQQASGRTQTELFDGYAFIVTKIEINAEESAQKQAEKERAAAHVYCEQKGSELSEVAKVTVAGTSGYRYTATNCYTDYTVTYLENGGSIYSITQTYTGDGEALAEYKVTTDKILSTLVFK